MTFISPGSCIIDKDICEKIFQRKIFSSPNGFVNLVLQRSQLKWVKKRKRKGSTDLEAEIRLLKKALSYEKLKSEALSQMIDIAEDEFKISIRKKSGAKQSKK